MTKPFKLFALSLELGSPLWTGDKKPHKGLEQKGIDWIVDTDTEKRLKAIDKIALKKAHNIACEANPNGEGWLVPG